MAYRRAAGARPALGSLNLPASAERAIGLYQRELAIDLRVDQFGLGGEQLPLCIEYFEVADHASRETPVGQPKRLTGGGCALDLLFEFRAAEFVGGQRIGHLAQCIEHGRAIGKHCLLAARDGRIAVAAEAVS